MSEAKARDISTVPEEKKQIVAELEEKIKGSKTVLVASISGLPASQFQKIKKKLRDKAEIFVIKKTLLMRAIDNVKKGALNNLKDKIGADVAIFFSDIDSFELSGILTENQGPARAKGGDIAPEDIEVEPGPTELMPGPAISELGAVGLKVAVENGKLAIKQKATLAKEGEEINEKLASVLGKLGIEPMRVGFIPVAAYDSVSDMTYNDIKIDKEGTLIALREAIAKSLNFSVNVGYVNDKTIGYFIAKAGLEGAALEKLTESGEAKEEASEEKVEEGTEEKKEESEASEENPAEEGKEEEKKDEDQNSEKEDA